MSKSFIDHQIYNAIIINTLFTTSNSVCKLQWQSLNTNQIFTKIKQTMDLIFSSHISLKVFG